MGRTTMLQVPAGRTPASNGIRRSASILLVDADTGSARRIQDALAGEDHEAFRVEWVPRLSGALEHLAAANVDVVLVSLNLPGVECMDAFDQIRFAAPQSLVLPFGEPVFGRPAQAGARGREGPSISQQRVDAHLLLSAVRYVARGKDTEAASRAAEEALFEEKKRAQVTLDSIGDAVLGTDLEGNVAYLNEMAEAMTGWTCAEAIGKPLPGVFNVIDGTTRQPAMNPARQNMNGGGAVRRTTNCVLLHRNGSESSIEVSSTPVHDRNGKVTGAVIVFRDVRQSRAMTQKMAYLAHHDWLTGLSNRALLHERLTQAVNLARRHRRQAALLFVDLDDFKQINDSFGHAVGDEVLQAVAGHLQTCVRTTDTVSRQGGDEFVILLTEIARPEDAAQVAEKLLTVFAEPLLVDGHALRVSMSIGISVYPDDADNVVAILKHGDTAMYHAKATGRNSYNFFTTDMSSRGVLTDRKDVGRLYDQIHFQRRN